MMVDINQQLNPQGQTLATITIDDFFKQINWSGVESPPENETELGTDTPYETVGQFFATFPWQGQGVTPSNPLETGIEDDELEQLMDEEDVLTLDDLSALF